MQQVQELVTFRGGLDSGAHPGHKATETNARWRELPRTNLFGFRSDPAFWTNTSVVLGLRLRCRNRAQTLLDGDVGEHNQPQQCACS